MKKSHRILTLLAALGLVVGGAVSTVSAFAATAHGQQAKPASPLAKTATTGQDGVDITGLYQFNANGSTGTLRLLTVDQGQVQADIRFYAVGSDEHVSGTWDSTTWTLTLVRPFGPPPGRQDYTLSLGGTRENGGRLMFGGSFTQSGGRYGAFAEYVWR